MAAVPEAVRWDIEEQVREFAGCQDTTCGTVLYREEDEQWGGIYPLEIFRFVHNGEDQRIVKSLGFDPPEFFDIALECFVSFVREQHGRAYRALRSRDGREGHGVAEPVRVVSTAAEEKAALLPGGE